MNFGIVGAGMASLACADLLKAAGHTISLFDKGRAPGGVCRPGALQTSLGEVTIDHGAQYFTARDPGFKQLVDTWSNLEIAAPWTAAGPDAWVGTPGMSAIIKQMASAHKVA